MGSIPGSGRSPREGNGNPLQYSCLGNYMDRGAWQATVHGITKNRTWLATKQRNFNVRIITRIHFSPWIFFPAFPLYCNYICDRHTGSLLLSKCCALTAHREGTPLQYSCLENPMGREAWWAAVHGVAKSRTRLSDFTSLFTFMHWRRKWQPTPVFLPGESQGWRSLLGCRLWGHTESDATEAT